MRFISALKTKLEKVHLTPDSDVVAEDAQDDISSLIKEKLDLFDINPPDIVGGNAHESHDQDHRSNKALVLSLAALDKSRAIAPPKQGLLFQQTPSFSFL